MIFRKQTAKFSCYALIIFLETYRKLSGYLDYPSKSNMRQPRQNYTSDALLLKIRYSNSGLLLVSQTVDYQPKILRDCCRKMEGSSNFSLLYWILKTMFFLENAIKKIMTSALILRLSDTRLATNLANLRCMLVSISALVDYTPTSTEKAYLFLCRRITRNVKKCHYPKRSCVQGIRRKDSVVGVE